MGYDKASFVLVPSGVKSGVVYTASPNTTTGDLDFSRGSTATRINKDGLIDYVASGVPRIDYKNGMSLLLEPSRTNLLTYSEDFSNAAWTKTNVTIDSNAEVSPDGRQVADFMRETDVTGEHRVLRSYSFTAGNTYSFSVYARHNGNRRLNMFSTNSSIFEINGTFDLVNGTAISGTGTPIIESMGNGWYRCTMIGISSSSGNANVMIRHRDDTFATTFAGNTNEYTELWGAQLELGSYATSYIPTTNTTVTRSADVGNGAEASFNDGEGVLFIEVSKFAQGYSGRFTISDSSTANKVEINLHEDTNRIIGLVYNSTATSAQMNYYDANVLEWNKIAVKYKNNDFALWVNGVEVVTDLSGDTPTGLLEFAFDNGAGGNNFYGRVKQVIVFNQALTDSQLQHLTS